MMIVDNMHDKFIEFSINYMTFRYLISKSIEFFMISAWNDIEIRLV